MAKSNKHDLTVRNKDDVILEVEMCVKEARVVGRQASMDLVWLKIQKTSQRNVFGDFHLQHFICTVSLHETEKKASAITTSTDPQFAFRKRKNKST